MKKFFRFFTLIIGCNFIVIHSAYANAGIPMITFAWPIFILALLPVILIESIIIKKHINNARYKNTLYATSVSNIVSTIFGIPIAWAIMLLIELAAFFAVTIVNLIVVMKGYDEYNNVINVWSLIANVTVNSAWLIPYEKHLYWMIPTAFIFLLLPFFFVSYFIEYYINKKILKKFQYEVLDIKSATFKANLFSYSLLFIIAVAYISYAIFTHQHG